MVVITGAAGFIASVVANALYRQGVEDLILVDDFNRSDQRDYLNGLEKAQRVPRQDLFEWLEGKPIRCFIHLGARTDTTEFDKTIFDELNVSYSKRVWEFCVEHQVPLIYASSAATYGGGEHGYEDRHAEVGQLVPLNPYGRSKQEFDEWALASDATPPNWYGLKFFNVYGPNEYHKGRMASVVLHAFRQISKKGSLKLFRSHHPDFKDGEQLRDFIYVKDIASVISFLMAEKPKSGIYNLGTGEARTFLDLAKAVFTAMGKTPEIAFIDTPEDIRDKYQYYTRANMEKLKSVGYTHAFTALEDGVEDYVKHYLIPHKNF